MRPSILFVLCICPTHAWSDMLIGLRWHKVDDLQRLQESGLLVRYVDRQVVLVKGSVDDVEFARLYGWGCGREEYISQTIPANHLLSVLWSSTTPEGLRGWALLRMAPERAAQLLLKSERERFSGSFHALQLAKLARQTVFS